MHFEEAEDNMDLQMKVRRLQERLTEEPGNISYILVRSLSNSTGMC